MSFGRDRDVINRRGYPEITDDRELIEKARELTDNWLGKPGQGHMEFRNYYFGDYYTDEPFHSFTDAEFKRIKELQAIEQEKYNELYEWKRFAGKPLSEEVIIRFLDRAIERAEKQYGPDGFYTQQAREIKELRLKEWRAGQVIQVDMVPGDYHEEYLYSDGTIKHADWGD